LDIVTMNVICSFTLIDQWFKYRLSCLIIHSIW
jgi:hypothetical protein